VELHLRVKGRSSPPEQADETPDALTQVLDLEDAAKEARVVAQRLQELKSAALPIWDESAAGFRPVEWSDMAVLLRAPANKAESYAKEFSRLNVPLRIERGGFYQSLEVTDLLSLLQMLDNPLQDLPVLAVLHSPLVGLTVNELAAIRLAERQAHFWSALVKWEEARRHEQEADSIGTRQKVAAFLERFARWRRLARQLPLSRCLDAVLTETLYGAWLLTQPRGEQRYANVQRLLGLAQQFDQFQRQGLFRFLRFIEGQQLAESEPDVAPVSEENSVRLMSIHQSKGLEFPVVAVADLGKAFNVSDLRADIILDEEYGLCPQIKPPHTGKRYPSLPYWLARQRQNRELLGEELRLLYVAMTRARDRLILSASVSEAKFSRVWQGGSAPDPTAAASVEATRPDGQTGPATLLSARSCADWLGLWFALNRGLPGQVADQGEAGLLDWAVHDDMDPRGAAAATTTEAGGEVMPADSAVWRDLQRRLSWSYPFSAATRQPAKTSVSALRRHAAEQTDEDAVKLFEATEVRVEAGTTAQVAAAVAGPAFAEPRKEGTGAPLAPDAMRSRQPLARDAAAQIGDAHHAFLQRLSLDRVGSIDELKQEAQGLERAGSLTAEEGAMLDFEGLAAFWNSDLGRRVRSQARLVQRELAFTARFSPQELAVITGQRPMADLTDEFVVVQGVTDLAVVLPREIWLLDFKTDNVGADRLVERAKTYEPQLALYARALSQIYDRPVSECWLYFLARRSAVAVKAPAM
jgi:ATP-dependent helicase/nuclease subunit A